MENMAIPSDVAWGSCRSTGCRSQWLADDADSTIAVRSTGSCNDADCGRCIDRSPTPIRRRSPAVTTCLTSASKRPSRAIDAHQQSHVLQAAAASSFCVYAGDVLSLPSKRPPQAIIRSVNKANNRPCARALRPECCFYARAGHKAIVFICATVQWIENISCWQREETCCFLELASHEVPSRDSDFMCVHCNCRTCSAGCGNTTSVASIHWEPYKLHKASLLLYFKQLVLF